MKTESKILKTIVLTVFMSMALTMLSAQPPHKPFHPGGVNHEQASPDIPAAPGAPTMENQDGQTPPKLDLPGLTNEQKDKIYQSDMDHLKTMTPYHNQVREKKARLQTLLSTSPFDLKAADQIAEDLGKLETTILKEVIRHDQELRNLLTPQQQVLFDARPKPFLHRL
ncbi:MAG: periplasmic heavy metal sensor [Bacteroidota bacterium]